MGGREGRKINKARSGGKGDVADKHENGQETENKGQSSSGNQSDGITDVNGRRRSERLRKMQKGPARQEETAPPKKSRKMKEAESDGESEERMIRESEHLLYIFPQEIWQMIAKFAEPETLKNLSNSSPFFRKILLPDRVHFLFPSVFKIMGPKFEFEKDEDEDKEEVDPEDKPCVVLNLRLVSSSWAKAIDDYYQNHPIHFKMIHDQDENINYPEEGSLFSEFEYTFKGSDQAQFERFTKKFEATHATSDRSPFIARAVIFVDGFSGCGCCRPRNPGRVGGQAIVENCRVFWNAITNLLLKFGHHLWYFTIQVEDKCPTPTTYYSKLREWLTLMPNLKVVNIRYFSRQEDTTRSALFQLQAEANMNPLPKLDNLKFLTVNNLPVPIFNALLASNGHVSMLEVGEIHSGYNIYTVPLPNLKKLSLKLCSSTDIEDLAAARVDWPLTNLYLPSWLWGEANVGFRLWSRLFDVVNEKFGSVETLTDLMLQLPSAKKYDDTREILEESCSFKLNFGHVTRLKLILGSRCALDFLLPMKESLNILEIENDLPFSSSFGISQAEEKQTVEFLGFENRLLESNIWTLFPNLNKLRIQQRAWGPYMYTRQYGQLKEKRL